MAFMKFISKIFNHLQDLRNILWSIYINFHYLTFKKAYRLPILVYKPKFVHLGGKINIEGDIKYGMIRLGFPCVSIYPNTGIMLENRGTINFKGKCFIGNNSAISLGKQGFLNLGANIIATTSCKIVCYDSIEIGDRTSIGWDCIFMDTDFHKLTKLCGGYSKGYAPIKIGTDNWFGNSCRVLKRTITPNFCTVSAGTILKSAINVPEYSVIGMNNKIEVLASDVWKNINDDRIDYGKLNDVFCIRTQSS